MDANTIVTWLIIGAVAGILADIAVRGIGLSLLEAIVVGIIGAFLGGWLFAQLGIDLGPGILGNILTAFIGAVILLLLIVAAHRTGPRRR
jgi:uncharacterized membrane protein YeaQ/YmgE (transglycosylase-associated protein family)